MQEELGRYLGTSATYVGHLEAGRRRASGPQHKRLDDLPQLLPPPEGSGPPAPIFEKPPLPAVPPVPALPGLGPLPDASVRRRMLQVLAQAARLRLLLHQQAKGCVLQQRREWGLGILQAGLLAGPALAAAEPTTQTHRQRWLAGLAADVAAAAPARLPRRPTRCKWCAGWPWNWKPPPWPSCNRRNNRAQEYFLQHFRSRCECSTSYTGLRLPPLTF